MGSNREDGGCRNGVAFWASFLRNNDPRRVDGSVGFNAQRAIHHWDMKGRRRRAPLGRLLCATGALAFRALQSLAAGVALCRRVCSISGARFLNCLPSFFPLPHHPFPFLSFRARLLARFLFWRSPSDAPGGTHRKIFGAACAGWLLGRRNRATICAWSGGKRAGRAPLFCLKWVGGGAGPTKTAELKNGRSPFFFFAL